MAAAGWQAQERKRQRSLSAMNEVDIQKQALEKRTELQADFRTQQLAIRSLVKEVRVAKTRDGITRGTITIILPGSEIEATKDLTFG